MKASELLAHLMDLHGDNPNSLAQKSKVPQSTIFRFISGTAKEPRLSTLEKLARTYAIPVEVFLSDQARAKYLSSNNFEGSLEYAGTVVNQTLIPVAGVAQLGENGWYDQVSNLGAEGYVEHYSDDPDAYALRVKGDSMFPAIRHNWYVVVEPNASLAINEYVAIQLTDERKMVKELLGKNHIEVTLMSVNGQGRLTIPLHEISAIHSVVAVVSPRKHKD